MGIPFSTLVADCFSFGPDLRMTQSSALHQQPHPVSAGYRSVPRKFVDQPAAWNPTVAVFLGGYLLAAFTIWGWFFGALPLSVLLCTGFLALHLEGTVIHDACHNAAHPNRLSLIHI